MWNSLNLQVVRKYGEQERTILFSLFVIYVCYYIFLKCLRKYYLPLLYLCCTVFTSHHHLATKLHHDHFGNPSYSIRSRLHSHILFLIHGVTWLCTSQMNLLHACTHTPTPTHTCVKSRALWCFTVWMQMCLKWWAINYVFNFLKKGFSV